MLKISPPSDLFPLVRSHSVSSQSLRSPPIFAGDGSAVAAYPEIRRQANLPASPYPFRPSPSLPLIPAIPSAPRHFSLAARSGATYPKDSPLGESPRFGWGGLSRRGPAPSLTPRLPSHAPPFPQPSFTLGGGCREGGSPPDFPSCPAALPAGAGRFPHRYRNPQSRLVRTPRPSRFSNLGTAEIASFQATDVCEASAECAPAAHGARPFGARTAPAVCAPKESGPLPETDSVRFRDSAPARLTGSPSRMP